MELNIKGPSYYVQNFVLEKEVVNLFEKLISMVKEKKYGEGLLIFDFCPIIAPNNLLEEGLWENSVSYSKLILRGTVFDRIDFETYLQADSEMKIDLIIASLVKSSKLIKRKVGKGFDCKSFCEDVDKIRRKAQNDKIV